MGGVAGARLAGAVSEAGGLGTLGLYRSAASDIRAAIEELSALTNKPFGVNFVPEVMHARELETSVDAALAGGARTFSFFSLIPTQLVGRLREEGSRVLMQVGSLQQAGAALESGADVLIVQGCEAGGHHRGTTALLPLLDSIKRRFPGSLILAAGGIASGSALVAILATGADGAWIGTRFVAASESAAHPLYKQRLIGAGATDTVVTTRYSLGWPGAVHRVLRTRVTDAEEPLPARFCGSVDVGGTRVPIPIGSVAVPTASTVGAVEDMAQYAGQGCELIDSVQPAAFIIKTIMAEAEATLARLTSLHTGHMTAGQRVEPGFGAISPGCPVQLETHQTHLRQP
jgi:nitronate monooxygenase